MIMTSPVWPMLRQSMEAMRALCNVATVRASGWAILAGLRPGAAVFFLWVGAYPGAHPAHTRRIPWGPDAKGRQDGEDCQSKILTGLPPAAAVCFLLVCACPGTYPAHPLGARCPGEAGRRILSAEKPCGLAARAGRLYPVRLYGCTVYCTVFCTVYYTALELWTLSCIVCTPVYRTLRSIVTSLGVVLCSVLCTMLCTELCNELCVALCTELCIALRTAVYFTAYSCVLHSVQMVYSTPHCVAYRIACCAPRWPQGPAQDGSS